MLPLTINGQSFELATTADLALNCEQTRINTEQQVWDSFDIMFTDYLQRKFDLTPDELLDIFKQVAPEKFV